MHAPNLIFSFETCLLYFYTFSKYLKTLLQRWNRNCILRRNSAEHFHLDICQRFRKQVSKHFTGGTKFNIQLPTFYFFCCIKFILIAKCFTFREFTILLAGAFQKKMCPTITAGMCFCQMTISN